MRKLIIIACMILASCSVSKKCERRYRDTAQRFFVLSTFKSHADTDFTYFDQYKHYEHIADSIWMKRLKRKLWRKYDIH